MRVTETTSRIATKSLLLTGNWTAREPPVTSAWYRPNPDPRFPPYLTFNFDGRIRIELAGSFRPSAGTGNSYLAATNSTLTRAGTGKRAAAVGWQVKQIGEPASCHVRKSTDKQCRVGNDERINNQKEIMKATNSLGFCVEVYDKLVGWLQESGIFATMQEAEAELSRTHSDGYERRAYEVVR